MTDQEIIATLLKERDSLRSEIAGHKAAFDAARPESKKQGYMESALIVDGMRDSGESDLRSVRDLIRYSEVKLI